MPDARPIETGSAASDSCFTVERREDAPAPSETSVAKLPPSLFGIMAATTLATFGTLTGSYQLFFY